MQRSGGLQFETSLAKSSKTHLKNILHQKGLAEWLK
jgi:hypothetical protein